MEKYILTITENGHDKIICCGTTLEGMRKTACQLGNEIEFAIYETKMVEYGVIEDEENNFLKKSK